jgi:hypothetical protein
VVAADGFLHRPVSRWVIEPPWSATIALDIQDADNAAHDLGETTFVHQHMGIALVEPTGLAFALFWQSSSWRSTG